MHHITITGSRDGMTTAQEREFREALSWLGPGLNWWHHGDCVGADKQAHDILVELGHGEYIQIHPPTDPKHRAWCASAFAHPPRPYLVRDADMVAVSDQVWAYPSGPEHEQRRSGTWATVRMARRDPKVTVMVFKP